MESKPEEEKKGEGVEDIKHKDLSEVEGQDKTAEIEVVERKGIKNDMSPFINIAKDWDDDDLKIPDDIKTNLFSMGFTKPSKIQAAIIPLASCEPYSHMIVQAPAGSGKTGAFGLTSLLRVDRSVDKIQVLVIVNTRELCNQIFSVYSAMTKGTGLTVSNFADKEKKPAMVCVCIHGAFDQLLSGRKPLDLSAIKCIVVDEADIFFKDDNFKYLWKVKDYKDVKKVQPQWLLFSATYPDENDAKGAEMMSKIVDENAKQIKLSASNLMERIKSVQQYVKEIEKGKKVEFIKEIFTTCEMTQTFIFVNTKNFAETVHRVLNQAGLKCQIMFSKMTKEERDKTMSKFRKQEIHVLITTDLIARGIDVPQAQLVINFDVPQQFDVKSKTSSADPATYLHRIGRTGRFGRDGLALTIYDRPQDKENLDQIIKHYEMAERIQVLNDSEQLKTLLTDLDDN